MSGRRKGGGEGWFRRTRWDPEIEAAFFDRLARSRDPFHKAQYVRIQASHLEQTGADEHVEVALRLLDRLLAEWPEDLMRAEAHDQRARCLARLGKSEEAVEAFRASFAAMRQVPGFVPTTAIDFGQFAVKLRRTDLYDEVARVLDEFHNDSPIHVMNFLRDSVLAIVEDHRGRRNVAAAHARRALAAASAEHSGLRGRPRLGLVTNPDPVLIAEVRRIARD